MPTEANTALCRLPEANTALCRLPEANTALWRPTEANTALWRLPEANTALWRLPEANTALWRLPENNTALWRLPEATGQYSTLEANRCPYRTLVTTTLFEKLFLSTGGVKMFHYLSLTRCERSHKNVFLINNKIVCD